MIIFMMETTMNEKELLKRISFNFKIFNGKPCLRFSAVNKVQLNCGLF